MFIGEFFWWKWWIVGFHSNEFLGELHKEGFSFSYRKVLNYKALLATQEEVCSMELVLVFVFQ
jgi:hypothetical protein